MLSKSATDAHLPGHACGHGLLTLAGVESSCKGAVGDDTRMQSHNAPKPLNSLGEGLNWALAETCLGGGGGSHRLFPAAVLHILAPTQKGRMSDTSNNFGESNNNFQLQTGHT
jgi:hypothetical protein